MRLPILWGLLHGINDWVAGYMLATFTLYNEPKNGMLMLIVYAIIGFGGQLPVGMWLDATRSFKTFSKAALLLLLLSPVAWFINPFAGIIVAGFSSAFVHVTGGAVCLVSSNNKVGPLGLFTAPGALGLALGSISGSLSQYWLLVPVVAVLLISLFLLQQKSDTIFVTTQPSKALLDSHDWIFVRAGFSQAAAPNYHPLTVKPRPVTTIENFEPTLQMVIKLKYCWRWLTFGVTLHVGPAPQYCGGFTLVADNL